MYARLEYLLQIVQCIRRLTLNLANTFRDAGLNSLQKTTQRLLGCAACLSVEACAFADQIIQQLRRPLSSLGHRA